MIKFLHRLLCLAFVGAIALTATAQRQTFYASDFPELTHANGTKVLKDLYTLDAAKAKYPDAFKWWTLILQQPEQTFHTMTVMSAAWNEALWSGNGSGFTPGVTCTSRNSIDFSGVNGQYLVNVGLRVLQGRFIGAGTSIGLNGNASTELIYDEARWQDPAPIRAIIISANWGSSDYLESVYIDGFRINGRAPGWLTGTPQHGIAVRMMGETARIERIYSHNNNGEGIWVNGAGPGHIEHVTCFDNNGAGILATNDRTGALAGNSLGMITITHCSFDNNGRQVHNRGGGPMSIFYIKSEYGLSLSRGVPDKAGPVIEAHGWIDITVNHITDSHGNVATGAAFVMNSTANRSRFTVNHYSQIAGNGNVNTGRSALLADVRSKQVWSTSDVNLMKFNPISIDWRGSGTSSTITCTEPLVSKPFNGTTRLGVATTYAGYDYAAATPVWDLTGGAVVVPPPTPCTYTYSPWTACALGVQTRTATASPSGCVGTVPQDSLSRSCTVTPPPSTFSGYDPNDVLVVSNTADPRSAAWAASYAAAWGIPSSNVIAVNAGTSHDASGTVVGNIRSAVNAKAEQVTVLAWEYPSRSGSQSITSAVMYGVRDVFSLTTSALYNYSGSKPRTDKGVAACFLLVSDKYIRRDAHGTNPTGQSILLLAKDQSGTPRGSARASQSATGVTVWDNRSYGPAIGSGYNACNYLSNNCWRADRKPGTIPVVAAYQSMFQLGDDGGTVWAKGFYGDHLTSFGGFLTALASGLNSQGQTPLTYHLDRGASLSVGSVSEPHSSLPQQFVDVSIFHPLFIGGKPVGAAAYAAVRSADRMLFAGDPMCSPWGK